MSSSDTTASESSMSLKEKWIAALRSGRYKQVTGRLRRENGHCCLGVLCDILNPDGWEEINNGYSFQYQGICSSAELPDNIPPLLGLESINTNIYLKDISLIALNDHKGYSFKQIADYIEENL
jgi:hypothetical protein